MTAPYHEADGVTLYHGDCLKVTEWLSADVLVTDPPYGIDYSTNYSGRFKGLGIVGDVTTRTRDAALSAWGDDGLGAVFASYKCHPFGSPHPMPLIWDKGDVVGMGDLSWPWRPSYELVWIYGKGWTGPRSGAVLRSRVLPGNFTDRTHPTEKPASLLELIVAKAPPGSIADPFAGSGSTLVAARNLGRKAIGVEIEERYCEIIARRLDQAVLPL